jgi:hypothetical protein
VRFEAAGGGTDPRKDNATGCAGKKIVKPSRRRPSVTYLREHYRVSERSACRVCRLDRGTCRYRSCLNPRTELRLRMREIAKVRVRYGYRKIRVLLNREGWNVSRYLAYRLYCEEGLALRPPQSSAPSGGTTARTISFHGSESGLEPRFRGRSVSGWTALSCFDGGGHLCARKPGD